MRTSLKFGLAALCLCGFALARLGTLGDTATIEGSSPVQRAMLPTGGAVLGTAVSQIYSVVPQYYYPIDSISVDIGDVSGDGRDDLVWMGLPYGQVPLTLFIGIQQPNGTLAVEHEFPLPVNYGAAITLADLNKDGRKDIILATSRIEGFRYFLTMPGGQFQMREETWINQHPTVRAAVLDVDKDGNLDVVMNYALDGTDFQHSQERGMLVTHFGDGQGGFPRHEQVETQDQELYDLESGDFNSDGWPDVATTSPAIGTMQNHGVAFRFNTDGKFGPAVRTNDWQAIAPTSLVSADFTADGQADVAMLSSLPERLAVVRQQPSHSMASSFEYYPGYYGTALRVADLNVDGLPDLIHMMPGSGGLYTYLSLAGGGFQYAKIFGLAHDPDSQIPEANNASLAIGDLNGDGVLDIAAAFGHGGLSVNFGKLTGVAGSVPGPPQVGVIGLNPLYESSRVDGKVVDVQVGAPADPGGSPVTGWTVFSMPSGPWDMDAGTTATTHRVTGHLDNTTYTYYARATNAAGFGPASGMTSPITFGTPPSGPVVASLVSAELPFPEGHGNWWPMPSIFEINLSRNAPKGGVSFDFATVAGTAQAGSDYEPLVERITIPEGAIQAKVYVRHVGDTIPESDEAFEARISNLSGAVAGISSSVATIYDDDDPAVARLLVKGKPIPESIGIAQLEVALSRAVSEDVVFDLKSLSGFYGDAATAPADYLDIDLHDLRIPAGSVSLQVPIHIAADDVDEIDEMLVLQLYNVRGPGVSVELYNAPRIIDEQAPPQLTLTSAVVAEGTEGPWDQVLEARLSAPQSVETIFALETVGASAVGGADYRERFIAGIRIPPGQTIARIPFTVFGDSAFESDETFGVRFRNVHGVQQAGGPASVLLVNDDPAAGLSVWNASFEEGAETHSVNFKVELAAPAAVPVTFDFDTTPGTAVPGVDYDEVHLQGLVIPAGSRSISVPVPIRGDALPELNETFSVNVSNVVGAILADGQGLARILNDDMPTIRIESLQVPEGNAGLNTVQLSIRLDHPVPWPVVSKVQTTPDTADWMDFEMAVGSVRIDPGRSLVKVNVQIKSDTIPEPDEQVLVQLLYPTGALAGSNGVDSAYLTILNDDGLTARATPGGAQVNRASQSAVSGGYLALVERGWQRYTEVIPDRRTGCKPGNRGRSPGQRVERRRGCTLQVR